MIVNIYKKLNKIIPLAVLGLGLIFAFVFALNTQPAYAAGETYTYTSSGSSISATGGIFGSKTTVFVKNPLGVFTGQGTITINNTECVAGAEIHIATGATTGTIDAPAYLNDNTQIGAPGSTPTVYCGVSFVANVPALNGSITIGGSTSNPAPPTNVPETAGQRQVVVTVYSVVPSNELPIVTATFSRTGFTQSQSITNWNNNIGSTSLSNQDPGSYTVCVAPGTVYGSGLSAMCQTATKVAGAPLMFKFGSMATVSNPTGDVVNVIVRISIPAAQGVRTYGPLTIVLLDAASGSQISSAATNSDTIGIDEYSNVPAQTISISATMEDIAAGTYKVCLDGSTTLCSADFTKEVNRESTAYIDISEEDSAQALVDPADEDSACAVNGVGWIVCPALSFISEVTDMAFGFLAKNFLESKAEMFTTTSATYQAWVVMRDLANVAFIIAFLVIVFSQVTSVGINNYGIKKMLPRIIIAAFLVNVSFLICQLAIEISDILGWSLNTMFSNIGGSFQLADGLTEEGGITQDLGIAVIVTALLAGGIGLAFAISIPVLLAALVALLMIVLILLARKALLVLLVVIAPLAFVAYLLPNTEQWFKKWSKMFTSLLLVFPIISVVFGASSLAAQIIKDTATTTSSTGDITNDWLMQLIAIGVAVIPLFVVPSILKKSMSAIPVVGSKLGGWSSKASGRASSAGKAQFKGSGLGSRFSEIDTNMKTNKLIKKASRRAKDRSLQHRLDNSWAGRKLGFDKGSARAQSVADEAFDKEVSAANKNIENANLTTGETRRLARGETIKGINGSGADGKAARRAAMQRVINSGLHDEVADLYNHVASGTDNESERVALASMMSKSPKKPKWFGGVAQGALAQGGKVAGDTADHTALIDKAVTDNVYSPEVIADSDIAELTAVSKRVADPRSAIVQGQRDRVRRNAKAAKKDPILGKKVAKNYIPVDHLIAGTEAPEKPLPS